MKTVTMVLTTTVHIAGMAWGNMGYNQREFST